MVETQRYSRHLASSSIPPVRQMAAWQDVLDQLGDAQLRQIIWQIAELLPSEHATSEAFASFVSHVSDLRERELGRDLRQEVRERLRGEHYSAEDYEQVRKLFLINYQVRPLSGSDAIPSVELPQCSRVSVLQEHVADHLRLEASQVRLVHDSKFLKSRQELPASLDTVELLMVLQLDRVWAHIPMSWPAETSEIQDLLEEELAERPLPLEDMTWGQTAQFCVLVEDLDKIIQSEVHTLGGPSDLAEEWADILWCLKEAADAEGATPGSVLARVREWFLNS
mmetsp:Transcript_63919/g.197892  ORF Transcript_63919/g.197892 Transcript_63919/m.197892 type:complete len:281 (-) Transcript_63919:78-920(-)